MRRKLSLFLSSLLLLGLTMCGPSPDTDAPSDPDTAEPTPTPSLDHTPAGILVPATSGPGNRDETVYAPDMRFPLEEGPAFLNSQIYGVGGSFGANDCTTAICECDPRNYSLPWHDNFCESRSRIVRGCPTGGGHQGQDIRPATCEDKTHWAVAAEAGRITNIGKYSVYLLGENTGIRYRYLHLEMAGLAVEKGDRVESGDRIGMVSRDFGTALTTLHLHFDMNAPIKDAEGRPRNTYISPYQSLVEAYQRLDEQ